MPLSSCDYEFVTVWHIDAPIERVWAALYDARRWPDWWKELEDVEELAPGDELGIGSLQRYTWKSRLPYRLTFDMCITRLERPVLLEGRASGEVEGVGRWRLVPQGMGTAVRYEWRIRTTKPWMNALAPVARPLFRWNHNQVMRQGGRALARFLNVRLLGCTLA